MRKHIAFLKSLTTLLKALRSIITLNFLPLWPRTLIRSGMLIGFSIYGILYSIVAIHAYRFLDNPPTQKADAALILGNRTFLNGEPNPCLTGRVDKGVQLAQQGLVSTLAMTGGRDFEDDAIEALEMEKYAKSLGFIGPILLEARSSSTQENLAFSRPILEKANINSLIIVSEPHHLRRTQKLVEAGHLGQHFVVSYAAAPSQCWTKWGMGFKGALREPLAIINNYAKGYF